MQQADTLKEEKKTEQYLQPFPAKHKVLFLNSHPIQYFAPLYKEINNQRDIDLTVLYCSKHGLSGELDKEFGVEVKWDIPVLEGYTSRFLKNYSFKPGIYGFFGLMNLGLIGYLLKAPKSTLIVHGWGYLTNVLAVICGKIAGHTVCIRGESPLSHERNRSHTSIRLRKLIFGKILFPLADYFLYIGNDNKAFYKSYGVSDKKMLFAPYAVDNNRFRKTYMRLNSEKSSLRKKLGLSSGKTVLLFSGKYIQKKRPLDLLQAFHRSKLREKAILVFMGEGELRGEMESYIRKYELQNVVLTGFVNQSSVGEYYTASDIFVMCSQEGETWGLSTNEAMNFNLPVLLSDLTGSSYDLVVEGENGYVFATGNIEDLAEKIDRLLTVSSEKLEQMGRVSGEIIKGYGYPQILQSILKTFQS